MSNGNGGSGVFRGGFVGFILGFVAGAIAALFLTTKTGEELKADIKKAAVEIRNKAEEKAGRIKNLTKEKYTEIVNNAISSYGKVKDLTEKEINFIKKIILEQKDIAK